VGCAAHGTRRPDRCIGFAVRCRSKPVTRAQTAGHHACLPFRPLLLLGVLVLGGDNINPQPNPQTLHHGPFTSNVFSENSRPIPNLCISSRPIAFHPHNRGDHCVSSREQRNVGGEKRRRWRGKEAALRTPPTRASSSNWSPMSPHALSPFPHLPRVFFIVADGRAKARHTILVVTWRV
jgi:hypothetical protein